MDSIDEARKREARNHLLMLPVVALLLVFILGIYIVIFSKEFEFFGTIFYGFAKAIWFLNLVFMGGSALILAVLSLSLLIMFSMIARNLAMEMHPWRPIIFSTVLLVVGLLFLQFTIYINGQIEIHIKQINSWARHFTRGDPFFLGTLDFMVTLVSMFITSFMLGLLVQTASLPTHARSMAEKIRTTNYTRPSDSTN